MRPSWIPSNSLGGSHLPIVPPHFRASESSPLPHPLPHPPLIKKQKKTRGRRRGTEKKTSSTNSPLPATSLSLWMMVASRLVVATTIASSAVSSTNIRLSLLSKSAQFNPSGIDFIFFNMLYSCLRFAVYLVWLLFFLLSVNEISISLIIIRENSMCILRDGNTSHPPLQGPTLDLNFVPRRVTWATLMWSVEKWRKSTMLDGVQILRWTIFDTSNSSRTWCNTPGIEKLLSPSPKMIFFGWAVAWSQPAIKKRKTKLTITLKMFPVSLSFCRQVRPLILPPGWQSGLVG